MPLWPFGRKKQRRSSVASASGLEKSVEKAQAPDGLPQSTSQPVAAQSPARVSTTGGSQRKRRRSGERARNSTDGDDERAAPREKAGGSKPRSSLEDITALPTVKQLDRSPHLRPAKDYRPAIPYARSITPAAQRALASARATPTPSPSARGVLHKPMSQQRNALREEEIKQMSAPVPIPKRAVGHGDVMRRDSKKARRVPLRASNDPRGSNVSLPFQDNIHSTMHGAIDQRGWEVGGLSVFNARPSVRLSSGAFPPRPQSSAGLSSVMLGRTGSRKGKLPAAGEGGAERDRRKIADLADDFDASDLRVLMERDRRRRELQVEAEQERLQRKLRRKAERQHTHEGPERGRREERRPRGERRPQEERSAPTGPLPSLPVAAPVLTDIHPAFRGRTDPEQESVYSRGEEPRTPLSLAEEPLRSPSHGSAKGGTYLHYAPGHAIPPDPFMDPEPQPQTAFDAGPFADPVETEPYIFHADPEPALLSPASPLEQGLIAPAPDSYSPTGTPMETPLEDPILETAQAVRFQPGRSSQTSLPPPVSPVQRADPDRALSPLRREYTPEIPPSPLGGDERRPSDSSATKRAGSWATFFRRGGTNLKTEQTVPAPTSASDASFSNTSRESMSRQPIPAHLVQTAVTTRRSGTPARTQSRFREDLPESPASGPDSRVQSPDLSIAAGHAAAARRGKRAGNLSNASNDFPAIIDEDYDLTGAGRTDSPIDAERHASAVLSTSLASVGSEASWLSGRPVRTSQQSPVRSSGEHSPPRRTDDFSASYENLGMPEEEFFQRLTPHPPRAHGGAVAVAATDEPTSGVAGARTPVRQGTVLRQPTIVHHGAARVVSREGLVTQSAAGDASVTTSAAPSIAGTDDFPEHRNGGGGGASELQLAQHASPYMQHAQSVDYGKGHARQWSAGSAKLLDIPPSRARSRRESPDTQMAEARANL